MNYESINRTTVKWKETTSEINESSLLSGSCLECISKFAKRGHLEIRVFGVLVFRTEHDVRKLGRSFNLEFQIFFSCMELLQMKNRFRMSIEKKKKMPVVIAKWETRAKMGTKTLSTEDLTYFFFFFCEIWKVSSITNHWKMEEPLL